MQRKALFNMDKKEVFDTLNEIRNLMEKSSKILSLSGMSAIFVGIYACMATVGMYYILGLEGRLSWLFIGLPPLNLSPSSQLRLLIISGAVLIVLCLATAFLFARRKAKRNNQRFEFDLTARRLLWHFFVPLVVGGVLCLALIYRQQYELISAIMLIFYGIALVNISNYTYSNTRYLGYAELLLGLTDSFVEGHTLLYWTIGFGIFHIIYGILFYLKYDRKKKTLAR